MKDNYQKPGEQDKTAYNWKEDEGDNNFDYRKTLLMSEKSDFDEDELL